MKKIVFLLTIIIACFSTTSCDKWDQNGDLDGMWQLLEWTDQDGTQLASKENMIFYSFQLDMAAIQTHTGDCINIWTKMKKSPTTITLYDPHSYDQNGHDKWHPMSDLASAGVPENGVFTIVHLSHKNMKLTTEGGHTLIFRKY